MDIKIASNVAGDLRRALPARLVSHAALLRQEDVKMLEGRNVPLALAAMCEALARSIPASIKAELVVKLLGKMISDAKPGVRFHEVVTEDNKTFAALVAEALEEMGGILR